MVKLVGSLFFIVSTVVASTLGLHLQKSADVLTAKAVVQAVEINNVPTPSPQIEIQIQPLPEVAAMPAYAYGNPAGCGTSVPNLTSVEMLANVQAQLPELDLASRRMDYIWNGTLGSMVDVRQRVVRV